MDQTCQEKQQPFCDRKQIPLLNSQNSTNLLSPFPGQTLLFATNVRSTEKSSIVRISGTDVSEEHELGTAKPLI